jgi:hypothetical protein
MLLMGGANYNVYNFEDESPGMMFRATCGANDTTINFYSGSYQSAVPDAGQYPGFVGYSGCSVTMIGTQIFNGDPYSTSPGKFAVVGYSDNNSQSFTAIGCWFQYAKPGIPIMFDCRAPRDRRHLT